MLKLLLLGLAVALAGCESDVERAARVEGYMREYNESVKRTSGLEDCTYHYIKDLSIRVIRCPASTTWSSYQSGKSSVTNVVVSK